MSMPDPYEFERIYKLQSASPWRLTDEQLWDVARYGDGMDKQANTLPVDAAKEFWKRCWIEATRTPEE